jgi:tetratricopeptide (TPR) repeat protein
MALQYPWHLIGWLFAAASLAVSPARLQGGTEPLGSARRLLLTGRYEEAAELYRSQMATQPVAAAIGWARCRSAVGQTAEAEKVLGEARETHPQCAELCVELARLMFQQGQYPDAGQLVTTALKSDANHAGAMWLKAELLRVQGMPHAAQQIYASILGQHCPAQQIGDPETLRWVALAAAQRARWTHDRVQLDLAVNSLCPRALALDPNFWPAHLEAGRLLAEKFNQPAATEQLSAALAINPRAAEIHAERARVALQNYDLDQARTFLERALQINPRLLTAHQLMADLDLARQQPDKAIDRLQTARPLNPASAETLGRLAAAYATVDDWPQDGPDTRLGGVIQEATRNNPRCARFFATLGHGLELQRRYPPAAKYYAESLARMPQLAAVRAQLGLIQMRLGNEPEAAELLEESFRQDPFNLRVKNMLEVLDVLSGYAVLETEHFVIKFDQDKDGLLARHAARYLEQSVYPDIVSDLGFHPPDKCLLEIFSQARNTSGHGWFSARMVGLPYLGTVAACAGKMVALVSPGDMQRPYNWARVLRHEFVHVVNLQQTHFNIPHWYTEALAVHYENCPRPLEWEQVLSRRAREDRLFDLQTINDGFARPADHDEWTLAYCQAELYAQFMVDQYGDDGPKRMLDAYADQLTTAQAVSRCFGIPLQAFESEYRQYLDRTVQKIRANEPTGMSIDDLRRQLEQQPDQADLCAQLAYAFLQRQIDPEARRYAQRALDRQPRQQLASYVLARLDLQSGRRQAAQHRLETSFDEGHPQRDALALLATLHHQAGDLAQTARLYLLGVQTFPQDRYWAENLARVCLQSSDDDRLAYALRQLARQDTDNKPVRKKLSQLALARGDHVVATNWAREALQIDVCDAMTHALLGQALSGGKQFNEAIEAYETALQLQPGIMPWQVALAEVAIEARQRQKARNLLDEILKHQPDHRQAQALKEKLDP